MSKRQKIPEKLASARLRACRTWPHASHGVLSMVPVEMRGLGTLAVDKYWRMYWDERFIQSASLEELTGTVLQEAGHLLLGHHKRAARYVAPGDKAGWDLWNKAADAAVNYLVSQSGAVLPEGVVTATSLGLKEGLAVEQYFRMLKQQAEDEQQQQSQGEDSDDDGEPQPDGEGGSDEGADDDSQEGGSQPADGDEGTASEDGADQPSGDSDGSGDGGDAAAGEQWQGEPLEPGEGGSCSDGQTRPWELPPPTDPTSGDAESEDAVPGLQEWEQQVIERNVAERVAKSMGDKAGGWKQMVDEVMEPKLDPRRLLVKAVSRVTAGLMAGSGRFSYRRPSRRPSHGGTIRPRSFAPVPRITVIIDTSASMMREELSLGLGLVSKVLNGLRLRDGVHVITGDTESAWAKQVFDPSKIELRGGGGTDMGKIIQECADDKPAERPSLIIVVTDGGTPWPEQDVGIPTVACITYQGGEQGVPSWIESIDIT